MTYTEENKKQVRDFTREGIERVVMYLYQTHGLPIEISLEKINEMNTLGEQIAFLNSFYKKHPNLFVGMKEFTA